MIAFLKGRLAHKDATYVIMEVGGIGYEVKIPLSTYAKIKSEESCMLFTHLHVKEDAHTLYGFISEGEKKTFLLLIGVNGVGPSTALMVLSTLSFEELQNAIVTENVKVVQQVKGIGAKSAQRIILELKDKIKKEISPDEIVEIGKQNTASVISEEAVTALVTLGYNKPTAEKLVQKILRNFTGDLSLEEIIKQALKSA